MSLGRLSSRLTGREPRTPARGSLLRAGVVVGAAVAGVAARDVLQREHAILRNFPLLGRMRFLLESVGPELRQYIVASNDEERPFSRDQRRWVYASSKRQINTFGFGTDNDYEPSEAFVVFKQSPFPETAPAKGEPGAAPDYALPAAKVLGAAHHRRGAFRAPSLVNISGMSYGSLSPVAVEALNRGAALAGCLQNTGEGGLADAHRHAAVSWSSRSVRATSVAVTSTVLSPSSASASGLRRRRCARSRSSSHRAPSPASAACCPPRRSPRRSPRIRGVPAFRDCASPSSHSAFTDVDGLIEFVERVADATGLPVGVKSAVGDGAFWERLAARMAATGGGPDFITLDGGEGGTGAAPLAFSDHVALPFKLAIARVYPVFARAGIAEDIVFIGAGRLGLPRRRAARAGARLRHDQRRPRSDAGHRLRPGPALPHRQLPDRCRHPQPLVDARSRSRHQARASGQLHRRAARRVARARPRVRRAPPRPDRSRPHRGRFAAVRRPRCCASSSGTSRSGRS